MPITPAYSWTQSSEQVVVTVTSVCITKASLDQFVGDEFVKINSPPCLQQLDQYGKIDPTSCKAKIMSSGVELTLIKEEKDDWPELTVGVKLDRESRLKRREACISRTIARLEEDRKAKKAEKSADKKLGEESNWEQEWSQKREKQKQEKEAVTNVLGDLLTPDVENGVSSSKDLDITNSKTIHMEEVQSNSSEDTKVSSRVVTSTSTNTTKTNTMFVPTLTEPVLMVAPPRRTRQVVTTRFTSRAPAVNHQPAREYVDKKALAILRASQRGRQVPSHLSALTEANEKEMEAQQQKLDADTQQQDERPNFTVAIEKYKLATSLDRYNAAILSNQSAALLLSCEQTFAPYQLFEDLKTTSAIDRPIYTVDRTCFQLRSNLIEVVTICGRALALIRSRMYLPSRVQMFSAKLYYRRALALARLGEWKMCMYDLLVIVNLKEMLLEEAVVYDKQQRLEYEASMKKQQEEATPEDPGSVSTMLPPEAIFEETKAWLQNMEEKSGLVTEISTLSVSTLVLQCKASIQQQDVHVIQSTKLLLALCPFSAISHIYHAEALKLQHTVPCTTQAIHAYTWALDVQSIRNTTQRNSSLRKNVLTSLDLEKNGINLLDQPEEEWHVHINAKAGSSNSNENHMIIESEEYFDVRGANMDGMAKAVAMRDGLEVDDDEDAREAQKVLDETLRGMDKHDKSGNQGIRVDTLLSLVSRDIHDDIVITVQDVHTGDSEQERMYFKMLELNNIEVNSNTSLDAAYIDLLPYPKEDFPPLYPLDYSKKQHIYCMFQSLLLKFLLVPLQEYIRVDSTSVLLLQDNVTITHNVASTMLHSIIAEMLKLQSISKACKSEVFNALQHQKRTSTPVGSMVSTYLTTVQSTIQAFTTLVDASRESMTLKMRQVQALMTKNVPLAAEIISEQLELISKHSKSCYDARVLLTDQGMLPSPHACTLTYGDHAVTIENSSNLILDEIILSMLWLDRASLRRMVPATRSETEEPSLIVNWEAKTLTQRAITHIYTLVEPLLTKLTKQDPLPFLKLNTTVPIYVILQTLVTAYLCVGTIDIQSVLTTKEEYPTLSTIVLEKPTLNAVDMFNKAAQLAVLLDQVKIHTPKNTRHVSVFTPEQIEHIVQDTHKVRKWADQILQNKQ